MGPGVSPSPKPPKRLSPTAYSAGEVQVFRCLGLSDSIVAAPVTGFAGFFLGTAQGREHRYFLRT
jgi:hypothetical protein